MRSLWVFTVAFLLTILLVGCTSKIEYVDRHVYITKYRSIDDQYLQDCPIVPPPDITTYLGANDGEREKLWSDIYIQQISQTILRNKKMSELREQNQYLKEQYDESIAKE